jgi:PadR family transcriptional regulator, regulatory protein AphA
MASDLRPFSYTVLALVGDRGAGAHDIADMMRRTFYWAAAQSQWYAEPKRLAESGYLSAKRMPGKTTDRTHYTLTAKGRRALREWLAQPATFPRIQSEASVRLLAGDLVDDETIVRSLVAMRNELDLLDAGLDRDEAVAVELPERTRYLLLNHRLGRRLIATMREWIVEVEDELGGESQASPPTSS